MGQASGSVEGKVVGGGIDFAGDGGPAVSLSTIVCFPPGFSRAHRCRTVIMSRPNKNIGRRATKACTGGLTRGKFIAVTCSTSCRNRDNNRPHRLRGPCVHARSIDTIVSCLAALSCISGAQVNTVKVYTNTKCATGTTVRSHHVGTVNAIDTIGVNSVFHGN